jgi:cytochrome P450
MSSWVLHQDQNYFPNPTKFDPDRWLNPKEARRLEKAFVPFGKGTRACVGMPYIDPLNLIRDMVLTGVRLAYCELYVTLGTLFRRFGHLKGNHLTPDDLVYDDYFSSYHPISSTKFHVSAGDS